MKFKIIKTEEPAVKNDASIMITPKMQSTFPNGNTKKRKYFLQTYGIVEKNEDIYNLTPDQADKLYLTVIVNNERLKKRGYYTQGIWIINTNHPAYKDFMRKNGSIKNILDNYTIVKKGYQIYEVTEKYKQGSLFDNVNTVKENAGVRPEKEKQPRLKILRKDAKKNDNTLENILKELKEMRRLLDMALPSLKSDNDNKAKTA